MARLAMVIDVDACIGCRACSVACKVEHRSPEGMWLAPVVTREFGSYPNDRRVHLPLMCMHCERPACLAACPTSAIRRRPDGIVEIDGTRCCGSGACAIACPNDAIALPDRGAAQKCDLCVQRIDRGQIPACVEACTTGARVFGDLDDPSSRVSIRLAGAAAVPLPSAVSDAPRVRYGARTDEAKSMLALRPVAQAQWGTWHAVEFTLLGAGAGLGALVATLALPSWLYLAAAGLVALGGLVLLRSLTFPLRAAGALRNQATSWISRGAAADLAFIAVALAAALGVGPLAPVIVALALVVTLYPALAMRSIRAVPAWRTWSLPALFAGDAVASGAVIGALVADLDRGAVAAVAVAAAIVRVIFASSLARRVPAAIRSREHVGVIVSCAVVLLTAAAVALDAPALPAMLGLLSLATLTGALAAKTLALGIGTKRAPLL